MDNQSDSERECMRSSTVSMDKFWDINPLIRPWMVLFLPANPMWADGVISLVGYLTIQSLIGICFEAFIHNELFLLGAGILSSIYFVGGWWGRWTKAVLRFELAKKEKVNGGK